VRRSARSGALPSVGRRFRCPGLELLFRQDHGAAALAWRGRVARGAPRSSRCGSHCLRGAAVSGLESGAGHGARGTARSPRRADAIDERGFAQDVRGRGNKRRGQAAMISYELYCKIRLLHGERGLSFAQIARELQLDPETVAKWALTKSYRPRLRAPRQSKLDPYKATIQRLLEH